MVSVSSPEDIIIAKLRWPALAGGSEKQFTDALRVYEVQFPELDLEYIRPWVERLHLGEPWVRLQAEAQPE